MYNKNIDSESVIGGLLNMHEEYLFLSELADNTKDINEKKILEEKFMNLKSEFCGKVDFLSNLNKDEALFLKLVHLRTER